MAQEDNKIILEKEQDSIGKWLRVYDNFMPIEKLAKFLQFCNSDIILLSSCAIQILYI